MKQLFVGAIALLLLPVMLSAIVVGLNDDVHFDYFLDANDFHIEGKVYSAGGVTPTVKDIFVFGDPGTGNWTVSGYSLTQVGPGVWEFQLDFVTDGLISYCQWIHFGIMFDVNAENIITELNGYWTLNGVPLQDLNQQNLQVAVTGFEVSSDVNGQFFEMMNDTNMIIEIDDIELSVSLQEIPLRHMNIPGLGRPGQSSPMYPQLTWVNISQMMPSTLAPGETAKVYLNSVNINLTAGQFLLIRGEQMKLGSKNVIGTSTDWGWFWEQHGE